MATNRIADAVPDWQRSISVFIPALNEENNLKPTVARLIEALTVTVEDYEIIIVDDGSSDATGAVADGLAAENPVVRALHNSRNMGLGYCFAQAYREARKKFFVYIPGDNTWPYRSFVELLGNFGRADIITSYAINPEVRPFGRRIVSRLYTQVLNLLFGRHLQYFNGLTIYPVDFLRRDPATTFGFGFQAEVLLKALNLGLSYIEVGLPIDERTAGGSKAVSLVNILSVLATLARVFFDLRIMRRWQPDDWTPRMSRPQGMMAIEELGFDPDLQSGPSQEHDPALQAQFVVVAGASSGIGAALAKDLSSAGYQVMACSRSLDRLQAAFADHPNVRYAVCDVSDVRAVTDFVEFVRARTDRVDVLINCAGGFGAIGSIEQIDADEWMRTVSNNLFGTLLAHQVFPAASRELAGAPRHQSVRRRRLQSISEFQRLCVLEGGARASHRNACARACAPRRRNQCIGARLHRDEDARNDDDVRPRAGGSGAVQSHRASAAAAGRCRRLRSHGHRLPLRSRPVVARLPRPDGKDHQRQLRSLGHGGVSPAPRRYHALRALYDAPDESREPAGGAPAKQSDEDLGQAWSPAMTGLAGR